METTQEPNTVAPLEITHSQMAWVNECMQARRRNLENYNVRELRRLAAIVKKRWKIKNMRTKDIKAKLISTLMLYYDLIEWT